MEPKKETSGHTRSEKHTKHKKTGKINWKKIGIISLMVVLILVASAAVMAFTNVKPPAVIDNIISGNSDDDNGRADGIYSVLVVGTDKVGLNTDTILVASLDSINNRASVMSIPRDTMSNVNRNVKKINAAYSIGAKNGKGNVKKLKDEVSDLMGFEVDNYVVVNLKAFEELIDAIGGVTIDVPRNMNYDDPYQNLHIHINKGLQTLNGEQAIGFVRYRSGYAEGDIGRVKAQQLFIEALVNQVATPATVTKMPKLIDIVLDNMDTDLSNGELIWFGKEVLDIDMENDFNMFILPGEAQYVGGLSYYLPYEAGILEVVNEHFNPNEKPITNLNVVDLAAIRQKEAARRENLTEEERQQEDAMQEQLENGEVVILDENGNPVENPSGEGESGFGGDITDNPSQENPQIPSETDNPSGGNSEAQPGMQPGGIPGEVLQGQEPVPEQNTSQNSGELSQPADTGGSPDVQPGGIPGEVLKQDAV